MAYYFGRYILELYNPKLSSNILNDIVLASKLYIKTLYFHLGWELLCNSDITQLLTTLRLTFPVVTVKSTVTYPVAAVAI